MAFFNKLGLMGLLFLGACEAAQFVKVKIGSQGAASLEDGPPEGWEKPDRPRLFHTSKEIDSTFNDFKKEFSISLFPSENDIENSRIVIRYVLSKDAPLDCKVGNVFGDTGPFLIKDGSVNIRAIACDQYGLSSEELSQSFVYDVVGYSDAVNFDIAPRSFKDSIQVRLAHSDSSARIVYSDTLASLADCTQGNLYTSPITVSSKTTNLVALACDRLGNVSPLASSLYTFDNVAPAAPVFNVASRSFKSAFNVAISSAESGAKVRYKTGSSVFSGCSDGSEYVNPVTVANQSTSISAVACDLAGNMSSVATANYTYDNLPPSGLVQFSTPAGKFKFDISLSLTHSDASAVIRYRLNSTFTSCSEGSLFNAQAPIAISNQTVTIFALACDEFGNAGAVASALYEFDPSIVQLLPPSISPTGRSFKLPLSVSISAPAGVVNASIRYTRSATPPANCQSGTLYTAPIAVQDASQSISAITCDPQGSKSVSVRQDYVYDNVAPSGAVNFSVAPSAFKDPLSVTLTHADSNATIRFRLNQAILNCSEGSVYASPINIASQTTTLYARPCDEFGNLGVQSSAVYTYDGTPPPVPTFSMAGRSFKNSLSLTLSSSEVGSVIRYTDSGTTGPTCNSGIVYQNSLTLTSSKTIRAVACDSLGNQSAVRTESYVLDNMAPAIVVVSPAMNSTVTSDFNLQGSCEGNLALTITGPKKNYSSVCSAGQFSVAVLFSDLNGGMNSFILSQTDEVGNIGSVTHVLNVNTRTPRTFAEANAKLQSCIGCHGANTDRSLVFSSEDAAFNSIYFKRGDLSSLGLKRTKFYPHAAQYPLPTGKASDMPTSGTWTMADYQVLEDWVMTAPPSTGGGTGGGGTVISTCDTSVDDKLFVNNQRITKSQLIKVLTDFFGATIVSSVQDQIDLLPGDAELHNFDRVPASFLKSNVGPIISIANKVAEGAWANTTIRTKIFGSCSTASTIASTCIDNYLSSASSLAARFFRRALTSTERTNLKNLYLAGAQTSAAEGFIRVLGAQLSHPYFHFRIENGKNANEMDTDFELTDYEFATRLSFAITDMGPDDTLLALAANTNTSTNLSNATVLRNEVTRLLNLPSAKRKFQELAFYWVKSDLSFTTQYLSPTLIGSTQVTGIGDAAIDETRKFMQYVIWDAKKPFADLLTSNVSFASHAGLASVYGHAAVSGTAQATFGDKRKGVFGRLPFLFSTSSRTPLIRRALKFREQVLCDEIPSPPDDVFAMRDAFAVTDSLAQTLSNRNLIGTITASPSCMSCHAIINPSGNIFEGYDSLGRSRTQEMVFDSTNKLISTVAVNSADVLPLTGGASLSSPSFADIAENLAANDRVQRCFSKKLVSFSVGQKMSSISTCRIQNVYQKVKSGAPLADAIVESVLDPSMKRRKITAQ